MGGPILSSWGFIAIIRLAKKVKKHPRHSQVVFWDGYEYEKQSVQTLVTSTKDAAVGPTEASSCGEALRVSSECPERHAFHW